MHANLGSLTPITSSSATSATEFSYRRSRSKLAEDKASDSTDVSTAMYAASLKQRRGGEGRKGRECSVTSRPSRSKGLLDVIRHYSTHGIKRCMHYSHVACTEHIHTYFTLQSLRLRERYKNTNLLHYLYLTC